MEPVTSLYYPLAEPPMEWLRSYLLFYGKVARFIPNDEDRADSEDFQRFRDAFPDVIIDIPSSDKLVELDEAELYRLAKAFNEILDGHFKSTIYLALRQV